MTKFEEEVKRPDNGPITELNNNMQEVFSQYRKMRQYADYLEYELKQKDEHILKVENENSFMRDERTTFDSNGMAVEPKFQQQALPVVPEFVAEWIEKDKNYGRSVYDGLQRLDDEAGVTAPRDVAKWVFENKENLNLFICAWLYGYTVEKPQLFYLKNKITGKYLRSYTGLSMDDRTLRYEEVKDKRVGGFGGGTTFTQSEIDSIETRSYEQIEVTE